MQKVLGIRGFSDICPSHRTSRGILSSILARRCWHIRFLISCLLCSHLLLAQQVEEAGLTQLLEANKVDTCSKLGLLLRQHTPPRLSGARKERD